jgi:hypothetical protein
MIDSYNHDDFELTHTFVYGSYCVNCFLWHSILMGGGGGQGIRKPYFEKSQVIYTQSLIHVVPLLEWCAKCY